MGSEIVLYPPYAIAFLLFLVGLIVLIRQSALRNERYKSKLDRVRKELEVREAEKTINQKRIREFS